MLSRVIISMQLDDQQAVSAALARSIVESAASSDQPHVSQESNAFDPQYSRVLAAISALVHHLFCAYPRPSADLLVCVRLKQCHWVILCFVCSSMHDNPFYTTCIMLGRSGIELGESQFVYFVFNGRWCGTFPKRSCARRIWCWWSVRHLGLHMQPV